MKARLIIDRACSRDCSYCCNKALAVQPIKLTLEQYLTYVLPQAKETIITGGEPCESPILYETVRMVREYSKTLQPIYMHSQIFNKDLVNVLPYLNGLTYTLHFPLKDNDLQMFSALQLLLANSTKYKGLIKHLVINQDIGNFISINPKIWDRVKVIPFIQDGKCPLPEGEILFELA